MPNISKDSLKNLIYNKKIDEKITVTPLIDKRQIDEGTIDLRLGTKFIFFKRQKISILDPMEDEIQKKIRENQEIVYCKYNDKIVLHPNEFVLGGSLEYVRLPNFISGHVVGRSSWGRLGLIIETSPIVQPCFMGIITYELTNVGNAPIALYPGCRIAQISFYKTDKEISKKGVEKNKGKYNLIPEPTFSMIYKDIEFRKKIFKTTNNSL